MGTTVIAAGRNAAALENLERIHAIGRLRTVQLTDDAAANMEALRAAAGRPDGADVYLDLSPPAVQGSSLLASGIRALRAFGRCVIMGGHSGNIDFPYLEIMFKSIRIQGRFMYGRKHVLQMIQMVQSGLLPLGEKAGVTHTEEFGLEGIEDALAAAARLGGWGGHVVLKPQVT
jgi:threonine dehydrogenase-like Zn-dependent dehydrogenase